MKKAITYGTFDLMHLGHINILCHAKKLGDHLTVAISTNEFNALKHKQAYYTFEHPKQILEKICYVDKGLPENTRNQKEADIKTHDIDVFVMGDDWKGVFDFLNRFCEVVYLPWTIGISTTKIKEDLHKAKNG